MLTPADQRIALLLSKGVPQAFLDALASLDEHGPLRFAIRPPQGAYFYLPKIAHYRCIAGYTVTPIHDGANGDVFHVHLGRGGESRFVRFALERDEIHADYGGDFQRMLADLMIDLYESADEVPIEELARIGSRIGFVAPLRLLRALEAADQANLRSSFAADAQWRAGTVPTILAAAQ